MATPFTHLLVAVASLATGYCVVSAPGNATADDMSAVAHAPAFRVLHGAAGLRDVAEDGFDYSLDSYAPKGARKSARDPARAQDGPAQRAR